MAWYNPLGWGAATTTAGAATANPILTGVGLGLMALPHVLKGGAWGIDKYKQWKKPYKYNRNRILSQMNLSPEAYNLQKQNLEQGLSYLNRPQNVLRARQFGMATPGNIGVNVPQQIENVEPEQPLTGLPALLRNMVSSGQRGYESDIGSYQTMMGGQLRYGSSNIAGALKDFYLNRQQQVAQNQLEALKNYARQNAIIDIEGQRLTGQQESAQSDLDRFLMRLRGGNVGLSQQDYLNRQAQEQNRVNMLNQYNQQRYSQAARQYQIGNQPTFNLQQQR